MRTTELAHWGEGQCRQQNIKIQTDKKEEETNRFIVLVNDAGR